MYISHVKLRNWRNFLNIDVDLQERMFLVGPNASGKSNLLDVFRFIHDIAKSHGGGLQNAVKERGGISKIRCLSTRKSPDIVIGISLTDTIGNEPTWRYEIGIKQTSNGALFAGQRTPFISYEKVWHKDDLILNRPDDKDKTDRLLNTQTHLEQMNMNSTFREIAKYFQSISYLHLIPQLLRHPEAFNGRNLPEDPYGRDFLDHIAETPEKTKKSRLRKIEAALLIAVPQLKQLTDTKDSRGVTHLEAVYSHWRPKAGKQNEEQFSDGTLRLMGLLWALLDGNSLLLLEEPELSLNAGIVRKLPRLMNRILKEKKRQLFISTHSADLLADKDIGVEEILMLKPGPEGTKVFPANSNETIRDLLEGGLTISDAIMPQTTPQNLNQLDLFSVNE